MIISYSLVYLSVLGDWHTILRATDSSEYNINFAFSNGICKQKLQSFRKYVFQAMIIVSYLNRKKYEMYRWSKEYSQTVAARLNLKPQKLINAAFLICVIYYMLYYLSILAGGQFCINDMRVLALIFG